MIKQIRSALAITLLLATITALAACTPSPAGARRSEPALAASSPEVSLLPSSPPSANNPCTQDGDSCVQGAALCRARGGSVLPLACSSPGAVCCAL